MNLQAQHDCGLSKSLRAARLSFVASKKPGQLRQTLTELESALNSWDQIVPDPADDVSSAPAAGPARQRSSGVPEEMKRRTRELLNQLKEQIDELSSDEARVSN